MALENFNLGTLFAVTASTWFGSNSRETIMVGLEHIPTWLTIISSSLGNAVYKRSTLAKIAQKYDKGNLGKSFQRSLETLMGGPAAVMQADGRPDGAYQAYFYV